ncbi:DNA-binding domain-containing protein [Pleionea sediminis]|uniref:HvfC family RiPP maturation protein n=1 Tax=Pleionea sediminis TaxID=2569479 RepID=UPI001185456D|nr:putative DNA-binding domain-containing protein [Pleionea sediminis]
MASLPAFQKAQMQFAQHLRNPDKEPSPEGIEDRRMAIYRELIYNNIAGFIESGFPVIFSLLNEQDWHKLVRQFIVEHRAHSPYFLEIAKEFVEFLQKHPLAIKERYPFIEELAHYEWVELALMIDPFDIHQIERKDSVDLMNEPLILSEVAWPLAYEFDVHHISADYQPTQVPQSPSFIVVYRDRKDNVEFTEINGVTFALLQIMKEHPNQPGEALLDSLAQQLPQIPRDTIVSNGLDILLKLMKRDIILGVSKQ